MLLKVRLNTPADDHTSLLSRCTVDKRLFVSASLWNGKSLAEMVWFGPSPFWKVLSTGVAFRPGLA